MSAAAFYDDYLAYHIKSGINDRIWQLYRRLVKAGLRSSDTVLEVGCGIGALSYLLAKKVRRGSVESFDISPKSIAFAKTQVRQSNVRFSVGDVLTYEGNASGFDWVLAFDVLEHVPQDRHPAVFKRMADWLNPNGSCLINLPNPAYILFDQQHNPDALQELDQPLFLITLLPQLEAAGLQLQAFESYSVWVRDDYHFLVLKKKAPFQEEVLNKEYSLLKRAVKRLQREWRKKLHPFPVNAHRAHPITSPTADK